MLKSDLSSKSKVLGVVDGVTFSIEKGRTTELVEESSCDKITAGCTTLRLYQTIAGQILYQETDIIGLSNSQMVPYRKKAQMIFQDPYISLDPRKNIGDIIAELIWAMKLHTGKDRNDCVRELIKIVGLKSDHTSRYPHESPGGQRQRTGIARTLAVEPEFIVCDEPILVLDASTQTQAINIPEELQDKSHFTYLFISHDLPMVRHILSEVGVIYLGNLTEYAQVDELYDNMPHPYTQSLVSAVPVVDPKLAKGNQRIILEGDVPSSISPAPSCPFRSRCHYAEGICGRVKSELRAVSGRHKVAYHPLDQPDEVGFTRAESQGQNHGYRITGTKSRIQNRVTVPAVRYLIDWASVTYIMLRGRKTPAEYS